jgi:hypothetical protein
MLSCCSTGACSLKSATRDMLEVLYTMLEVYNMRRRMLQAMRLKYQQMGGMLLLELSSLLPAVTRRNLDSAADSAQAAYVFRSYTFKHFSSTSWVVLAWGSALNVYCIVVFQELPSPAIQQHACWLICCMLPVSAVWTRLPRSTWTCSGATLSSTLCQQHACYLTLCLLTAVWTRSPRPTWTCSGA